MRARAATRLIAVTLLLAATAIALSGCGIVRREPLATGPTVSQQRNVTGFDRVSLSGPEKLVVAQGSAYSLEVSGAQGELDTLKTEVRGDTLYIEREAAMTIGIGEPSMSIKLTLPELAGLSVSGAGDARVGTLTSKDFDATVSGAGRMTLDKLVAQSLRAEVSGAGRMTAAGSVPTQDLRVSGAGSYDAAELGSADARVDVSGGGNVSVTASGTLSGTVSGGGRVEYSGSPTVGVRTSGGGSVRTR